MGLIAVVYRDRAHLPFDMDKEGAEIDNRTGAIYFRDPERKKLFPREQRQTIRIKLGTSHDLVELTKQIGPLLGAAESILSERVLYDLSHSGDIVEVSELQRLDTELESLRERVGPYPDKLVSHFIDDMKKLVAVARDEKKPIVFV